jgi:nucleoporin NUP42
VQTDLSTEVPRWILSSYGAAKHEPNLFLSSELSPEELRWKSTVALKENRAQEYVSPVVLITPRKLRADRLPRSKRRAD